MFRVASEWLVWMYKCTHAVELLQRKKSINARLEYFVELKYYVPLCHRRFDVIVIFPMKQDFKSIGKYFRNRIRFLLTIVNRYIWNVYIFKSFRTSMEWYLFARPNPPASTLEWKFEGKLFSVLSSISLFLSTIEILYALNDDGRRILDNNFHSHRANKKRMGSCVSEIYFESIIQEGDVVSLTKSSFLTSRKCLFACHICSCLHFSFVWGNYFTHKPVADVRGFLVFRGKFLTAKQNMSQLMALLLPPFILSMSKAQRWIYFVGNLLNERKSFHFVVENRIFFISFPSKPILKQIWLSKFDLISFFFRASVDQKLFSFRIFFFLYAFFVLIAM